MILIPSQWRHTGHHNWKLAAAGAQPRRSHARSWCSMCAVRLWAVATGRSAVDTISDSSSLWSSPAALDATQNSMFLLAFNLHVSGLHLTFHWFCVRSLSFPNTGNSTTQPAQHSVFLKGEVETNKLYILYKWFMRASYQLCACSHRKGQYLFWSPMLCVELHVFEDK